MKERPILYSPVMVEAIEDDRKTMTRRVVKGCEEVEFSSPLAKVTMDYLNGCAHFKIHDGKPRTFFAGLKCPYGKIGDILWVKESHWAFGEWEPNGTTKTGKQRWEFKRHIDTDVVFKKPGTVMPLSYRKAGWYKRPSLFLQKRDARLFLRITNIRVERLQDISEDDACNEGIEIFTHPNADAGDFNCYPRNYMISHKEADGWPYFKEEQYIESFRSLWISINGEKSWNDDPWVWVIEFEKLAR